MKKLLMAAVAATAIGATPAMAATSASYDVTGTVGAVCSLSSGTPIAFTGLTGADGSVLSGATVVTPASDAGAYCNGAKSTLTVQHTKMKLQANGADSNVTPPTGFVSQIDYTPVITVGGLSTEYNDGTAQSVGAFSGLTVSAKTPSVLSGKPLAGDYKGTITISVNAAA